MNMNLEIEDPFSRLNWVVNEMEWDHCLPNFLSLHLLFLFFSSQPMKENKDQQNDTIILQISIHFWLDRLWAFILMFPLPCSSNPLAFLNVGSSSSMIKNLVQTLYLIEGIFWTPQIVLHDPILETFSKTLSHYMKIRCLYQSLQLVWKSLEDMTMPYYLGTPRHE